MLGNLVYTNQARICLLGARPYRMNVIQMLLPSSELQYMIYNTWLPIYNQHIMYSEQFTLAATQSTYLLMT